MSAADIRPAHRDDVPRAVETLGAAFADYPWTRYTIAADDHAERIRRFQRLFVEQIGLPHGKVWIAGGGAAVSVWTTPDSTGIDEVFARLGPTLGELAGDRAEAAEAAEAAMRPHRPTTPVWFLGSVGVHPDHQGGGLGRAVIRPGLEAADAAGTPAYLETSLERNVAFYRRLGFDVTAEVELPGEGPRTWAMVREPA